MPYRHKGIPDSWIRFTEAAHRLGLNPGRITCWGRLNYFPVHKKGNTSYVCWIEMQQNRHVREALEKFQAKLAHEADEPLTKPNYDPPPTLEPAYVKESA